MAEPSAAEFPRALGAEHPSRPKVIYVLGAHRSGSTILGVTLGNCEDTFFAGELHSWQGRRGVPTFGGERGAQLWERIREQVQGADDLFGKGTQLYVDRSSALYRVHKWPTRRRLKRPYRRMTESLFNAISNVTGCRWIVDTSHYPLRARELQSVAGIDLYILFLSRSPQGIVTSMSQKHGEGYAKGRLEANLQLWVTYLLSLSVFLRHPRERRMFVRHEDFLADPHGVLRQILDRVGSCAPLPDLTALHTGCALQGNRLLRYNEVIALRGPSGSAPASSPMTRILQAPWPVIFSRLRPAVTPRPGSAPADH